ncbi:MAG: carbonic anhydrase family protein [Anaerolineae bacterium]|nr:carbonic anhydrase family protein [Anaerolineae bacterium]
MSRRKGFAVLLCTLAFSAALFTAVAQEHAHWTYEGEEGPSHWGELEAEFALCSTGTTQSPIDIELNVGVNIDDIAFDYAGSALNILNNGHTIQVNYDAGSSITYGDVKYDLVQFHFHTPSEHTVAHEAAPMEVHFVHRSESGALAVVGVMLTEGETANAAYAAVFDHLPAEESEATTMDAQVTALDMLPETRTFFTYAGSLTTPPCSEGVRWLLLDTPVQLSAEQIEAFKAIFELNARPVQPQNARDVIHDTGSGS